MTYSIIARDPATGKLGIAVQSRSFAAGRIVPWIEAGVGVIASQSFANPVYGYEGLRLLRAGQEPQQILDKLVSEDAGEATRQVAIMDKKGRVAVHTGHEIGVNCSAQANMMLRDTVWKAMVQAFESASGEMADRLLVAMEAAEHEGGDIRGRQAASLIVVTGKPSGIPRLDTIVDLRVDDHPDPVNEIRRLLSYSRASRRAGQAGNKAMASDFVGALADLDECCAAYPNEAEFLFRRAMVLMPLGRIDEARAVLLQAKAINPGGEDLLLRFADAGLIPVKREMLEPFVASLSAGNQGPPTM